MPKGGRRLHAGGRRKPTEMKVLQGTFRADRHGAEVKVAAVFPDPPAGLSTRELGTWNELRNLCGAWTAPSDKLAIHGVVALYDRLARNHDAQRENDGKAGSPLAFSVKVDSDGTPTLEPKENPLLSQEVKLWRELRAYIAICGLSAVDRAKVAPAGSGDDTKPSTLARLLKKGGA